MRLRDSPLAIYCLVVRRRLEIGGKALKKIFPLPRRSTSFHTSAYYRAFTLFSMGVRGNMFTIGPFAFALLPPKDTLGSPLFPIFLFSSLFPIFLFFFFFYSFIFVFYSMFLHLILLFQFLLYFHFSCFSHAKLYFPDFR
jgi:hypothetical protein